MMRIYDAIIAAIIFSPNLLHAQEFGKESMRERTLRDTTLSKEIYGLANEKKVIEKSKIFARASGYDLINTTRYNQLGKIKLGDELILQRNLDRYQLINVQNPQVSINGIDFSRNKSLNRVLNSEDLKQLSKTNVRLTVEKQFCQDPADSACRSALVVFGASVQTLVAAKDPNCKNLQSTVSELPLIRDGDLSQATSAELLTVSNYYAECTSTEIPAHMLKLLGVLIDTTSSLKLGEPGVLLNGKKWPAIGMAVQLSSTQIFTARHVIFNGNAPDGNYSGRRKLENLMFVPVSSPGKGIPLAQGSTQSDAIDDSGAIPRDQVRLLLSTAFDPGQRWPIVRNFPMAAGSTPLPLVVAGFQLALVAADMKLKPGPAAAANWTQYIRKDASNTCSRVTQNVAGCLLHSCDSIGGLSGTPIFATGTGVDADRAIIIGVHHGVAPNQGSNICNAGGSGDSINIAVVPNKNAIQN